MRLKMPCTYLDPIDIFYIKWQVTDLKICCNWKLRKSIKDVSHFNRFYEQGHAQGLKGGGGSHHLQGQITGQLKALEWGSEMGYYLGLCEQLLLMHQHNPSQWSPR